MQFVSMEVNRYGSNDQLHLGPLSQGLNAICGPTGSGKTTLLNWLRQMVIPSALHSVAQPAWPSNGNGTVNAASHLPLFGKVEIRNQQHSVGITQTSDGQRHLAHLTPVSQGFAPAAVLTPEQQHAFNELTSIQTATDTIQRLELLAKQLGFDQPVISGTAEERRVLLARQSEIHSRLRTLESVKATRERLLSERGHLEAELHRVQREHRGSSGRGLLGDRERLEEQRVALSNELRDLRAELATLERDIAGHRSGWPLRRAHHELDIGATYREQLEQLDARLDRWRQTLRDLRAHRERLEHNATDARLDKQIGDQLSISKVPDPRAALRSLENQILNATRQLEVLVDRHDYNRDLYASNASLPETLRSMQRDLYEVCQQLARHESTAATETLRQQATQLSRAENELLQSVEKLIEERAALLRKIAAEYHLSLDQLTLAFGDWCECHDHPHLYQWLVNESPGAHRHNSLDQNPAEFYQAEAQVWDQRHRLLVDRVAELNSQLKEIESQLALRRVPETVRPLRSEADVLRDLDKVSGELRDLEERDRLRVELDDIRRSLAKLPVESAVTDRFRALVNRHIDGLVGSMTYTSDALGLRNAGSHQQRFGGHSRELYYNNRLNGTVAAGAQRPAVPTSLLELATRLAIVELMAERGTPISLVLDSALDHLSPELQQSAMRHLQTLAASGQQIVLLSSDERVAELVRSAHGWVGYLRDWKAMRPVATRRQRPAIDLNKQLLAYANDHEAEKWSEPLLPKPPVTRYRTLRAEPGRAHQQLTERSLIEDCPSLDSANSARCRALGIDRVGDLLATDAHWLAEHLRVAGVTSSTIERWQAEAKLLCSVPQLRAFDARVLVGAGIRHPRQLAEMHPSQLLDRVERFLGTDRGREILRSGNSYELSRITSWIASAKGGERRYVENYLDEQAANDMYADRQDYAQDGRSRQRAARPIVRAYEDDGYAADDYYDLPDVEPREPLERTYEEEARDRSGQSRTAHSRSPRTPRESAPAYQVVNRDAGTRAPRESQHESYRERPQRAERTQGADRPQQTERPQRAERPQRTQTSRDAVRVVGNGRKEVAAKAAKYYLELASPIVDAPSIGPRVATRLEEIGIYSVEQLLAGNADAIAQRLQIKRVDGATVRDWQDQSRLVCRIPNLRGHDAQLLVACRVTSPEELSKMNAASLLPQVVALARSTEGQRILRGSQEPDMAEVTDWINWASNSRSLNAA